jgi:Fe-S-cluster-containing dehydrogenase component
VVGVLIGLNLCVWRCDYFVTWYGSESAASEGERRENALRAAQRYDGVMICEGCVVRISSDLSFIEHICAVNIDV